MILDIHDVEVRNYFKEIMHEVIKEHSTFANQKITSKDVMRKYNIKSQTTMVKYRKEGLPTLPGRPLSYDPREVELWMQNRITEKLKKKRGYT